MIFYISVKSATSDIASLTMDFSQTFSIHSVLTLKLKNKGTDCFCNVTIQLLSSLPDVREFFLNQHYKEGSHGLIQPICNEISRLFHHKGSQESVARLRHLVAKSSNKVYLDNNTQQDTVEFLESLLCEITKELPVSNIAGRVLLKEFRGLEKTERKFLNNTTGLCTRYKKPQRIHQEEFQVLKVTLPPTSYNEPLQLPTIISSHFSEDTTTVKMKCSNCCKHEYNCPQCLTLTIQFMSESYFFCYVKGCQNGSCIKVSGQ